MTRYITVLIAGLLLSGCLGGTVAQQIARSIAAGVADKTMARAMDVDEDQAYSNRQTNYAYAQPSASPAPSASLLQPYRPAHAQAQENEQLASQNSARLNSTKRSLQDTPPDPYQIAIASMGFEKVKPTAEPLPAQVADTESTIEVIQSNQLVRVELFNLLIGKEKDAVYEQARLMGSITLPPKREWQNWQVAIGVIKPGQDQPDKKIITFLIPPEFGKLPSGAITMVELASPGELNVARYKVN